MRNSGEMRTRKESRAKPQRRKEFFLGVFAAWREIFLIRHFAILLSTFPAGSSSLVFGADSPVGSEAEAPLVGRKEPFCGAVGSGRFLVITAANPTSLQAGNPILLTIRIQASGAWTRAPERPDLANKPEYAKFRQQFHIDKGEKRASPDRGQWEFDFRLRPKSERVKEVPSLVIVYFRPGFTPSEKGYMTTAAPAIPLQVASRAKVLPSEIRGQSAAREAPGYLYEIATGPAVLRQEQPPVFPAAWLVVLLSAVPPAISIGWYVVWKQRNPTQARLSRLRKSRAARQALLALEKTVNGKIGSPNYASKEEACNVADALTGYLRERLDLRASQPTPADISSHLLIKGISADLAERTSELFRACDALRYSPQRQQGSFLRAEAADLVAALESQP